MDFNDPDDFGNDDFDEQGDFEEQAPGSGSELEWRDTYYILFEKGSRPTVTQLEAAIADATDRVSLENLGGDEDGFFESVLVQAPQDNAALEINFEAGEAVVEQSTELAKMLQDDESLESDQLAALLRADARLDVMHFERVNNDTYAEDEEMQESLDPTSLLTIVEALAKLTSGLPIDPGSGVIMG